MFLLVSFIDNHVLRCASNCHPWWCFSHELIIVRPYVMDEHLIFLAPGQYFIFFFLFVSYFMSVPCSGLLNLFESVSALGNRDRWLFPHSH